MEYRLKQKIVLDVEMATDVRRAAASDSIDDTLDYSQLRDRILRLMAEHRVQLLEALAEQIAHIVLYEFRALWVRVRLAKPRKFDDVQAVGVLIGNLMAARLGDSTMHGGVIVVGCPTVIIG